MKKRLNQSSPFIETSQGIFLPSTGWLKITKSFLEKQFPQLFVIEQLETFLIKVESWVQAEINFPVFVAFLLSLSVGFVWFIPIYLLILMVVIGFKNTFYSLKLETVFTLFNYAGIQIGVSIALLSYLGMNQLYVDLSVSTLIIFLHRLHVLDAIPRIIGTKVFKKVFRHEQFLQWICFKESIKRGFTPPEIEEMKRGLEMAIQKSSFLSKKKQS